MSSIKKIFSVLAVTLAIAISPLMVQPSARATDSNCSVDSGFLGFPFWYRGLANEGSANCELKSPANIKGGIGEYITIIASNILSMAAMAVVYISVGFVTYGGFQYITSSGSADAVKKAKDTIRNAIIGLVIAILAGAIFNFINGQLALGIN